MFLNLTAQRQNERRIVVSHLMKFDIRFGSEDEGTEHKGNVLCVLVDGVPGCPTRCGRWPRSTMSKRRSQIMQGGTCVRQQMSK